MKVVFVKVEKKGEGEKETILGSYDDIETPAAGSMIQFEEGARTPDNLYICFNPIREMFGETQIKVPVLTLTEHQQQRQAQQMAQMQAQQKAQQGSGIVTPGGAEIPSTAKPQQ